MIASVIRDRIETLHCWIGLLLIFWLPLDKNYIPFLSFIWVLTGVFTLHRDYLKNKGLRWKYIGLFFAFYILHIISVFYSNDTGAAWFDLEIKLPLFFFPLLSTLLILRGKTKRKEKILLAFVLGNFVAIFICLGNAFWGHDQLAMSNFLYVELSYFHHPAYFAMYLAFALSILLFYFLPNYNKKEYAGRIVLIILSSIMLGGFIILLSSRAGILVLFILVVLKIIHLISSLKINTYLKFGAVVFLLAILVLSASQNQRVQQGVNNLKNINSGERLDSDLNSMKVRFVVWKSGLEIVKNHWPAGIGNGDVKDGLMHKAKELFGPDINLKRHYNAHNQYIDTFVALGLPGLLVLLALLLWPFIYAIKKGHYLLLSLVLILLVSLFFESMINRQAGVMFFAFFLPMIFGLRNQKR
ncbi:MAG: O-antigen ligase family protein [Bacteroidales bacterium]|nr:O-antigen ligase family protein [Bacteroidales bacterium]